MWSSVGRVVGFGLFTVITVASLAEPARGQTKSAAAAAELERGRQAEAAGHKREAVDHLKKAYEVSGDPNLLFRLGELSRETGDDTAALRFYQAYLRRSPRGEHSAIAERQVRVLEWSSGQGRPAAPATSAPAVTGSPGATPPTNGAPTGPAVAPTASPAPIAAPSPGTPHAAPTTPPPWPVESAVPATGAAGVDLTAQAAPPRSSGAEPPLPRWVPWAGFAAAAGLGLTAVLTGLSANEQYDQLRNSCGATAGGCSSGQIDDMKSRARTTNILLAGAGVVAVATGVAVYFNTREAGLSGLWRF